MPSPLTAKQVWDREFLEIRCKVLELAAAFDRLYRADGSVNDDPRHARLRDSLNVLQEDRDDRAEQVQLIFSRSYSAEWRDEFQLDRSPTMKPR